MSRTIRLSLALLFALMMVIATASAALAFQPRGNSALTGFEFPAITNFAPDVGAVGPGSGVLGPWHATLCGGDISHRNGPIEFDDTGECPSPP